MTDTEHPRSIRSFVTRAGRITEAQERALEVLWPKYGVELGTEPLDLDALFGRGLQAVRAGESLRSSEVGPDARVTFGQKAHGLGLVLRGGRRRRSDTEIDEHDPVLFCNAGAAMCSRRPPLAQPPEARFAFLSAQGLRARMPEARRICAQLRRREGAPRGDVGDRVAVG